MEDSYARLLRAAKTLRKADNPAEVARLLEVSDQTIQNWKTRGVPDSKLLKIEEKIGVLPKWIATGEGDMLKSLQVNTSNLTSDQRQMLAYLDSVDKEARNVLLSMGKILAKHKSNDRTEQVEQTQPEKEIETESYKGPDRRRAHLGIPYNTRRRPAPQAQSTEKEESDEDGR